jgi:hypothetical protein
MELLTWNVDSIGERNRPRIRDVRSAKRGKTMEWTRSDTLGMAQFSCVHCHGLGLRDGRLSEKQPCNCVLRSIFRICYVRFCQIATQEKRLSKVTLDGAGPQCRRVVWGRKDEEYMADFLAMVKRTLTDEEHKVFRWHYLLGGDWRICCEKLALDKAFFFYEIYKIEAKLGRIFRETQPYGLYPIDEYYGGVKVEHTGQVIEMQPRTPVRPPLQVIEETIPGEEEEERKAA